MSAASVSKFFGLKRGIVGLLAIVVLVGLGEHMGERFVPIYLLALGASPVVVGLFQGLNNLLNAFYSFPGGYLADRIGVRRSLAFFTVLTMAGFAVVYLFPSPYAVIGGSVLFLAWSAVSQPAMMNYIFATLPPERRTMGVAINSLVRRVPKAVGPVLGGTMIGLFGEQLGVRYSFLIAFGLALAGLVAVLTLIENPPAEPVERKAVPGGRHPLRLLREMSPSLRGLLISDTLIRFCEQIPFALVVVWCMKVIERPVTAEQFGWLTAIEMTTALLIYIPVAHYADRFGKRPFVLATFIFFTLFPVALIFCQSFWSLAAAFVLRGLKEFGDPTRKALIFELSPPEKRASMFGLYYLIRDTIVSLAAVAGAFLWIRNPVWNLVGAAACGAAGTIWFVFRGRDVGAERAIPGGRRPDSV